MVVSLYDTDRLRHEHPQSDVVSPLSLSPPWLKTLCDCGTQEAETDRQDAESRLFVEAACHAVPSHGVSLSACYDLAFCISGTLRLTDWKPVSQTLSVFTGVFGYLVCNISKPADPPFQTTHPPPPHNNPTKGEG